MQNSLPYVIRPAEPGAQIEFYLPKKSVYQGMLYDALTKGFDIEHVRNHFRDEAKRPRIDALLEGHGVGPIEPEQIVQTYWGYSLYEMDGVFKTKDRNRAGQTDEERVQVVRIIFRPDMDAALRIQPDGVRLRQLIDSLKEKGMLLPDDLAGLGPLCEADRKVLALMAAFFKSVRLFIVGYLMFEVCDKLWAENQRSGQKLEDEIWITLVPNLMINRFIVPSQSDG